MTRPISATLLFCMIVSCCFGQENFAKKLQIYRNNVGLLELEGRFLKDEKVFNLLLPDSVIVDEIEVYSNQQSNIANVRVLSIVEEEKTIIRNKQEFLLANIGKRAELEVVEGGETINYEGEILPLEEESKVLLLKSEGYLRMIPISEVAHISIKGEAKMTAERSIVSYKLMVEFVNEKAQKDLTIRIPIRGLSWEPIYTLWVKENRLAALAKITNNSFTESDVMLSLMDAEYNDNKGDAFCGLSIAEWGEQKMYKEEILQKPLFEEEVSRSAAFTAELSPIALALSDSGITKTATLELDASAVIFNNSKNVWPSGQLQIIGTDENQFMNLPLLYPDNGTEIDLGSRSLDLTQSWSTQNLKYSAPNVFDDSKKKKTEEPPTLESYEIAVQIILNNPYPKAAFYKIKCDVNSSSAEFSAMKARLAGSPLAIIDNEIEIKGNISGSKESSFELIITYQ